MHKQNTTSSGFTIVELLIVIVIIAILAAISIVAYTGIQNRAHDTAVQSDLKNIGQKFLEFQVLYGRLPGITSADLTPMGLKVSRNSYGSHFSPGSGDYNMAYCFDGSAGTFAIVAASKSGNLYGFRGGAATQAVGPLTTILTTCSNNGIDTATANWLYGPSSWHSSIGG